MNFVKCEDTGKKGNVGTGRDLSVHSFCKKIVNRNSIRALVIAVKIPDLRACEAICSTDCHVALAKTDCNEKHARLFGGNAKNSIFIQIVLGFGRFTEINKNKILFLKNISIFALYTTKIFKSSLNDK